MLDSLRSQVTDLSGSDCEVMTRPEDRSATDEVELEDLIQTIAQELILAYLPASPENLSMFLDEVNKHRGIKWTDVRWALHELKESQTIIYNVDRDSWEVSEDDC